MHTLYLGGFYMKTTTVIALTLTIIGAIVWLLVGLFDFNLVSFVFGAGGTAIVSRIIYSLVGIAGLWLIFYWAIYKPFRSMN